MHKNGLHNATPKGGKKGKGGMPSGMGKSDNPYGGKAGNPTVRRGKK